jgi:hypothetical protein
MVQQFGYTPNHEDVSDVRAFYCPLIFPTYDLPEISTIDQNSSDNSAGMA